MSVLKSQRSEGNLKVLDSCQRLAEYTIQRCTSEKIFPKRQRWVMANKTVNAALDAMTCIRGANSVLVQFPEDYKYRRRLQVEAHAHLGTLLSLIDVAYHCFGVDAHTVEVWSNMAVETSEKLKNWMKSDKERYKFDE